MRNQTGKSGGDVVLVLLVDDEEHQRELTELSLVGADPALVITAAQTPSQALSLLLEQPFDCLVSDYQMPGMNGVELCAEVRKKSKIPFIIYTGRGSEEVASQAFAAGVDDYVRKEKDLAHYQVLARRIRQAAERHRTSELYRVSVEANREGVSIIQGTEIVYANQAMADMLGEGGASDLIGRSITRWLVEGEKESVVRRALSRQGGRNEQGVFLYSVRRADGAVRILHASASIISYRGLPASIVFNHDDTEQRNTEDALRESGARLSALYSSMTEGVAQHEVVYDAGGAPVDYVITDVNPAYEQITGISRGEVRGKKASEIYGSGEAPFLEIYARVAATGKPESFETYFPPMGKHFNISSFSPGKGKFVTVFQDITERRVAEEEIKRANENLKSLNDFLSRSEEELTSANEELQTKNEELQAVEEELRASNEELAMYSSSLEKMVNERTLGIKAASERLAAFINSASEGFSIYDSTLRIVDVNEAWLKRLPRGMTKSDVIGKHISDIYPGIEETPRYKEYLKVMKTGTPYNYEGYLAGDVVKRRYYFASVFKVGDGIGIVSRDATAHMELEREADETRRRLEAFMDSATEGFSLYDSKLRLVDINRAVLNRFPKGTKEEDLIGKHITELYPGFEETEWYEAYKKVLETGVSWYGEGGGVGVMAGTYLSASAFKVGAGLGVVSRDISEHMEADEKLYESSLYARSLIEASLDPLVTISAEGKITDVNEATVQATGVPRGNLIGSDFSDYFTDPERARTGYKQVFSEGFVQNYPLTIRHASGKLTEVLYNATVYTNLVGEVIGVFATARDVTEKNRLEKQLIRADRMGAVGKLTAMLAHDLRNPLNFIRQASDMALQEPERAERLLQLIGENAERSLKMIEDLRSGTKEISLQRASTNLTQLIAKTAEEIKMPDGVEMEIATGEGVGNIDVDAGLMRRVLDNLVTNAVEAMPEGGRLAIRTSVGNGNVCIDVEDTGVGIPPEATPRIFDTFYSTKPKGLGLGLSFCRRAVEAHGGTLTFTSKKGAGTTFTVTLPTR